MPCPQSPLPSTRWQTWGCAAASWTTGEGGAWGQGRPRRRRRTAAQPCICDLQPRRSWSDSLPHAAPCCPRSFLSPIYGSISKPGLEAAFPDADALAGALAGARHPVLALGGVTLDKFAEARRAACACAARCVCAHSKPRAGNPQAGLRCICRRRRRTRCCTCPPASPLLQLRDLGFAGAALLGAVWQAPDPVAALEAALHEAERL